jgi:hypothetical protein
MNAETRSWSASERSVGSGIINFLQETVLQVAQIVRQQEKNYGMSGRFYMIPCRKFTIKNNP